MKRASQVLAGEMIDDDDRPAGNADAAHFGGEARRVGTTEAT